MTELLDEFRSRGFAPEQTTLGGFSQGCLMAIEIGMRYPHRLAGIVGISGRASNPSQLIAEQSALAKQQRFFITHGTLDQVIPFSQSRDHVRELQGAGLNIEWHELVKPHTIAGEEEISLIREFVRKGYE